MNDIFKSNFYTDEFKSLIGHLLFTKKASEQEIHEILESHGALASTPKELLQLANV